MSENRLKFEECFKNIFSGKEGNLQLPDMSTEFKKHTITISNLKFENISVEHYQLDHDILRKDMNFRVSGVKIILNSSIRVHGLLYKGNISSAVSFTVLNYILRMRITPDKIEKTISTLKFSDFKITSLDSGVKKKIIEFVTDTFRLDSILASAMEKLVDKFLSKAIVSFMARNIVGLKQSEEENDDVNSSSEAKKKNDKVEKQSKSARHSIKGLLSKKKGKRKKLKNEDPVKKTESQPPPMPVMVTIPKDMFLNLDEQNKRLKKKNSELKKLVEVMSRDPVNLEKRELDTFKTANDALQVRLFDEVKKNMKMKKDCEMFREKYVESTVRYLILLEGKFDIDADAMVKEAMKCNYTKERQWKKWLEKTCKDFSIEK